MRDVDGLPAEAETLVARIEGLLAQAEPLLAQGGADEAAYALRETERRYLPDTLRAYTDIPPARRDATAQAMLVDQLRLLERATAQRLATLSESAETQLSANGAFLTERFGALETLPDASAVEAVAAGTAPPAILVRRMFDRLQADAGSSPVALIENVAGEVARRFPAIVSVHRSGFLGRGPVDAVALDVPRRDDMLRYALARTAYGGVEATVTRFLRGIKNKTVTAEVGEWIAGLMQDLSDYAERDRSARETLTRFF
ncbi:MAG TPA: hypothetical protein VMD91_06645 [Candidatus Sulfotelmatobacter sp.]|nr:hypothetical protein [Candidatus Sulfotelmatobacter sp.]